MVKTFIGKIRHGALDLRDEPEPANQAGAFDPHLFSSVAVPGP